MSDLGELDRPETPRSPGAWDERSQKSLTDGTHDSTGPARRPDDEEPPPDTEHRHRADRHPEDAAVPSHGPGRSHGVERWNGARRSAGVPGAAANGRRHDRTGAPAAGGATAHDGGAAAGAGQPPSAVRRAAADPVKTLLHRHRDLCERAVDPLEIAAALEAHGVTDRTAARFRHRDVFSLAEEMYARVPRDGDDTAPRPAEPAGSRAARPAWIVLTLLPGVLCAAAVAGLRLTEGRPRLIAAGIGALAVALALRAALRSGPLRATARTSGTWTCWLLGYALLGDGLLRTALTGGPDALPDGTTDGPWPVTAAPVLALALSCVPAAGCAHLFATRARRRLTSSRGLADFSAAVRPLLLGTFALYTGALAALLALTAAVLGEPAAYPQALTLGALLLLARLLTVHGHAHAATLVLTATAAAEATALATLFAGRLPGCGFLTAPVEALVAVCGPAGVPTAACGIGALTLLVHATRRLTRASAHAHGRSHAHAATEQPG
ncbi:hypothetical protein ACFUIW_37935 [Streptomyces sp. NPDC057245]|uniref:hypothetical protein n=1 Tax=Streptomyces sp. NPDC057245 TaxID=3346065 RepID=UPI003627EA80